MEHVTAYSMILLVSLMSGMTWSYGRNRPMQRIQRGLRVYVGRTA